MLMLVRCGSDGSSRASLEVRNHRVRVMGTQQGSSGTLYWGWLNEYFQLRKGEHYPHAVPVLNTSKLTTESTAVPSLTILTLSLK